jgi:hypothetical protein
MQVAIDKYINQDITSSKPMQYAMTAIESVASICLISWFTDDKDFYTYVLQELFLPELNRAKVFAALPLIHKYIWDQPNDSTVELDQNSDVDGIKMEAVIHSFDTL